METELEITLLEDDEENSNPHTEQNSTDAGAAYEDNYEAASIKLTTAVQPDESLQDKDEERQEDEMAEITKTSKKPKGSGLDKFKRRLIRAIARLNDHTPTEEMWEELKKQSGCDCQLLWNRMRTLTMKKLRRLFSAEDKIANITQIAQLTVTDWLLFDLVLVHEKLDVIGQELQDPEAEESPKILEDLFATVVVFDLERLQGDPLTKAWFEATSYYNGTERRCSPMLLQRRWYQLKAAVREKIYQFWFEYRGSQRQLAAANEFKPTSLEMEIVKLFKYITTKPFPTWEELIEQKKVALPEDFERLQLAKRRIFRTETGPDLEVIEPHVETIDLDQHSDSEDSRDSCIAQNAMKNIDVGIVKKEKVDKISDADDDVHILESMDIPLETNMDADGDDILRNVNVNNDKEHTSINVDSEDISIVNDNQSSINANQFKGLAAVKHEILDSNEESIDITEFQDKTDDIVMSQDDCDMLMPTIVASTSIANNSQEFDIIMPKISSVSSVAIHTAEPVDDVVNNEINGILKSVAENISTKNFYNVPKRTEKTLPTLDSMQNPDELVENIIKEEINSKKEIELKDEKSMDSFNVVPNDLNIFDGIILEDDGIEYIEEEDHIKDVNLKAEIKTEKTDDSDSANTPTIDLKLLLTPVVYTKKLDDMDVFRFIDYNAVKDKRILENADGESKPVDRNSVKMEEISQRPPTPDSDSFSDSASEYYSEAELGPECISPSSWLLNKLRNVSYNPIQLCKNPDFNTRLKRLSAGFFSLERNRRLLKECKPLTIDLHKSFEAKLLNNTLYLSGTKSTETKRDELQGNVIGTTMLPVSLPIQNLVDNVINDILGPAPPSDFTSTKPIEPHVATLDVHPAERNKIINLPDIAQIRRLNERLLTAEVTPIQVLNTSKVPVTIVSAQQSLDTAQNNPILHNNNDIINKDSNISSTASNINDRAPSALNKINITPDARSQVDNLIEITNKSKSLELVNNVTKGNLVNRKKPVRINRVEVPWNVPKKNIIPQDRLLTSDTVDKILSLCKGDDSWLKSKTYKKAIRKKFLKEEKRKKVSSASNKDIKQSDSEMKTCETSEVPIDDEVSVVSEIAPLENVSKNSGLDTTTSPTTNEIEKITDDKFAERVEKDKLSKSKKYCCWAREKIIKLSTGKRQVQKHKCLQPFCNCCCRRELVDKMFEVNERREKSKKSQMIKPKADQKSKPLKINITSHTINNKPKVSPIKVSVGINTDFDADFETTFAANLAEHNTSSKNEETPSVSSIRVSIRPNMNNQVNGQTQTSVNLMVLDKINPTLSLKESSNVTPITIRAVSDKVDSIATLKETNPFNFTPSLKPIVLNKNNLNYSVKESSSSDVISQNLVSNKNITSSPSKEFPNMRTLLSSDIKYPKIAPKKGICRTIDHLTPLGGDPKVVLEEKSGKLDKVLFLTNDKWKSSRAPICLGKNKILLCSFEKPAPQNQPKVDKSNNVNQNQICNQFVPPPVLPLPEGVRIVLLPNKELAVSIDPGVELDSSQLEYLPTLMASIQQQLHAADAAAVNIANSHVDELKNKGDPNNQNNIILENLNESEIKSNEKEINNGTLMAPISLTTGNKLIEHSDDIIEVDTYKNKKDDSDKKEEDTINKEEINCVLDKANAIEIDLKDDSDLNKKTILSDLMEMSGISAEDTRFTNHESPTKQQPELSPLLMVHGLRSQITNRYNEKFMNNPLFNNPVVKTALNRCPELCIVFSYTELRYASENNAQFFKMDIETGVVVPINLVIKKQMQAGKSGRQFSISKSVIDLTDDPEEDETISIDEPNAESREVETVPGTQKDRVVPVKLFSSVNPSILRRSVNPSILRRSVNPSLLRRSLLVTSVKSGSNPESNAKSKKMIRIIKVKRKRKPIECVASIDLDSDSEQKESSLACASSEAVPEMTKSADDSDSDDEPLAFKAKRMKESNEPTEPSEPLNRIIEGQEEKLKDNNEIIEMANIENKDSEMTEILDENIAVDDIPKNIPDQAYVSPMPNLDEPVLFEPLDFDDNMPQSSDEDCILGV